MAQRRNTGRKLPAKTAPATKQSEDIVTEGPDENAADIPAGTDLNMGADAKAPDEDGVVPKTDAQNIEIPKERAATKKEAERESIDPDSDVENPHMDAKLGEAKVQTYVDDLPNNSFRKSWKEVLDESGVVPPKGRILFPDEPITYEGFEIDGEQVVLTKDIYRMVLPFRSNRPTFTLLARAGRRVPKGQLLSKSAYEKAVRKLDAPEDE